MQSMSSRESLSSRVHPPAPNMSSKYVRNLGFVSSPLPDHPQLFVQSFIHIVFFVSFSPSVIMSISFSPTFSVSAHPFCRFQNRLLGVLSCVLDPRASSSRLCQVIGFCIGLSPSGLMGGLVSPGLTTEPSPASSRYLFRTINLSALSLRLFSLSNFPITVLTPSLTTM